MAQRLSAVKTSFFSLDGSYICGAWQNAEEVLISGVDDPLVLHNGSKLDLNRQTG